jgi:hypothetical protein
MVVLAVEIACDGITILRRNPEIGAASVEHDLEVLGRGTERDLGEVYGISALSLHQGRVIRTLGVQEVGNGHEMCAISDVGSFEDLLGMCLGLNAHVLLTERLRMFLDVCVLLETVRTMRYTR